MASVGKKAVILSDSICQGIDIKWLNKSLKNVFVYKKIFPGATADDLHEYSNRTLKVDKPDIALINIGINNIKNEDPHSIAGKIVKVVQRCQKEGCNSVLVSSITPCIDY